MLKGMGLEMKSQQFLYVWQAFKGVRLWHKWLMLRQKYVGKLLSALYGRPVMIAPQHAVALAGVAVLWSFAPEGSHTAGGQRMLLMVRPKEPKKGKKTSKSADRRARFISCLGLGTHTDMPSALHHTLTHQVGPVFTKLLGTAALSHTRVAAAPLLTLTDEDTGGQFPLQLLVWVTELRPHQEAAIKLHESLELVWVAEDAMDSPQVSPTHRQMWQAVQPHVQRKRPAAAREDGVELISPEDANPAPEARKPQKILH